MNVSFIHRLSFSAFFVLMALFSWAQSNDTLLLNEVSIVDYRTSKSLENVTGIKIDSTLQSNFLTSSMAQMLLQQNVSLVKSYGAGNIASLGIRGSTAQQTAVVWNGININNPMLGQADISLLPVGFFNTINLQKGALSGYWGSGAMAGVLNVQSNTIQTKGLTVLASTTYSSLQNSASWASVNYVSDKFSTSTKLLGDFSQNKYQYFTNTDSSLVKTTQQHAKTQQLAVLEDFIYKLKPNQTLGLHIWWQNANRQIPFTTSALQQNANQTDKTFRAMLDWKLQQKRFSFNTKLAFFNESILYNNTTDAINSNNQFKTLAFDVDAQYKPGKGFSFNLASSNMFSFADSPNFSSQKELYKNALFENVSWNSKRNFFSVNVYAREELFNLKNFVPTEGITTNMQICKWLAWKINAGTVYRYPTLNDLYWSPGGNMNLKPEQGHSEETSLQVNKQVKYFHLAFTGTIFSRNIHNNIMWLPGKNGVWSPVNILQVWSRGMETNTGISYKNNSFKTSLNINTNYILSSSQPQNSAHYLQMPYAPMYSGSAALYVEYKKFIFRCAYTYTGYRYLSSDNYSYLKPYYLLDVRLAKTFSFNHIMLNIFVEVNNLLNKNYQSITQYGMPLRNYKAGLIIQYHHQIKNNASTSSAFQLKNKT